jgi:hypothetical protein
MVYIFGPGHVRFIPEFHGGISGIKKGHNRKKSDHGPLLPYIALLLGKKKLKIFKLC